MFIPRGQNAGKKRVIKTANISFKNMANLRHFGKALTNPDPIREDRNSTLNLTNTILITIK
jgi:hypothetical protein